MRKLLLSFALLASVMTATAQKKVFTPETGALLDGRTIVKTNLFGYALGSYSISVERLLSKRFSVQLGYSNMPNRDINSIVDVNKLIDGDFKPGTLGNETMSIDVRMYLSRRGYGHGFYLQPYFRHEQHKFEGVQLQKESLGGGYDQYHPYDLNAKIKSNNFGLSLGAQWLVGKKKNIVIDWTIIGVHYSGSANYEVVGVANEAFKYDSEAKEFEKDLTELLEDAASATKTDIQVKTSEGGRVVSSKVSAPYVFLRGSLSVGFRF